MRTYTTLSGIVDAGRDELIEWLASNDRNGVYTDEDLKAEDMAPMTGELAISYVVHQHMEEPCLCDDCRSYGCDPECIPCVGYIFLDEEGQPTTTQEQS